ncbi:flavin monoamine oxidase family protein [Rhizorhabdus dicambivorans]|uniref:Tryptophan 2-monooxygenase n=1 Tax=Rhizorhabdus dicambivorans TaxID=1850238 RepID=A0A2A4G0D2_9SPHN|nr:NAD(P)/FAD-dependent oxidoreductase [Rhizorhabdus dicambivorans]ATE63042.1 amine oxidase [Rhizorhabdus dicambivorans]PCE43219.1 amine oxidase [Rhizorhabdus dicambivorans]
MSDEFDVVIIGAGAAGIGAARSLAGHGLRLLLVDAQDRIGGRACSLRLGRIAVDMGCGYLHSAERNRWVAIGRQLGFTIDQGDPGWRDQYRNLGFSAADQHEAMLAFEDFTARLRADPPASDRAGDALLPDGRWNAYIEALSGYINGAGFDRVSAADYLAYDDAASELNWRVREGYGSLIAAAMPASVEARFELPVTRIDHGAAMLALDTDQGTIRAHRAIVTVPTPVLASGALAFDPPLPAKQEAAAALPLGHAEKIFLALGQPDMLPRDGHLLGNPHSVRTGSYQLRPMGYPLVEGFFGGKAACELERLGPADAAAFAIDELAALLGNDIRAHLHLLGGSAWGRTRWIEGGYSHALPGMADRRAVLAEPVDDRIFFAGEACSTADFSTAHGALDTGLAAARSVLASLRGRLAA